MKSQREGRGRKIKAVGRENFVLFVFTNTVKKIAKITKNRNETKNISKTFSEIFNIN